MLGPYRRVLRTPHLPGLLGWSLVGRLHMTGTPIALTFLVAGWTGSYSLAGLVVGAWTVGTGIGGPLRGRAVDRRPADRVLLWSGAGYGVLLAAVAVLPASLWLVSLPLAFAAGLLMPPVSQVARTAWARLEDQNAREATYAVEATLQELLFIIGPTLAAFLVATVSPRASIGVISGLALVGSVGFATMVRRSGRAVPERTVQHTGHGRRRTVLRTPGLAQMLATQFLVVGALLSVDLLLVAWARSRGTPSLAGVLSALFALGSAAGGLVLAGRPGRPRLVLRMSAIAAGLAVLTLVLPPLNPSSPWLVGVVLVVAGTAIAPSLAAVNSRVGALVPDGRRGEAFGWLSTAVTFGTAAASPVIGALLDRFGPAAGAAASTAMVLAGALLSMTVPRPDARSDAPAEDAAASPTNAVGPEADPVG